MTSCLSDVEEQKAFVESLPDKIEKIKVKAEENGRNIKILCTDEASFRRDGSPHNAWYLKGETAEIPESNGRFESIKLFGAVDPFEGDISINKGPKRVTTEVYGNFLIYLSKKYPDRELVIMDDNAPWHSENKLLSFLKGNEIENINIIRFPKYSPKMNPCEKLWKWLRESVSYCRYNENLTFLMSSIWRFYRRAWNNKELAKIRFKTEIPIFEKVKL
jgi:transposase